MTTTGLSCASVSTALSVATRQEAATMSSVRVDMATLLCVCAGSPIWRRSFKIWYV